MNGGPSGFHNAPVTRILVIACAIFTIFFGVLGRSNNVRLSYQDIFRKLRVWKLIVSVFAFSSTPELMFGLYLLYYFRIFERQIGSNKYSVFILFSVIVSSLFELLATTFLKDRTGLLMSGPYGLIFSLFVAFFFDIPVSTQFRVFGVRFFDKTFIYLAGLQLLLSSRKRSILSGICGILAGSLYHFNIFYVRRLKFPESLGLLFSWIGFTSGGNPSAAAATSRRSVQVQEGEGGWVSEELIGSLVSMGFDRNSAREALLHARNDLNVATNILLEAAR